VLAAASIYLSPMFTQVMIVTVIVIFALIWVGVEDFGGILAGGATDPNSGPLVILFALIYWPLTATATPSSRDSVLATSSKEI
jgi:hypothetical protein